MNKKTSKPEKLESGQHSPQEGDRKHPLAERLVPIVRELHARAGHGHEMSKEEIDDMWGHG
jgi:hypothetical protein